MERNWTEILNLVLGVPVFGVLLILVMMRKVVPGWLLTRQEEECSKRVIDLKEGYQREITILRERLDKANRDEDDAREQMRELGERAYREMVPTIVRANDSLKATQDLLQEIAIRASRGNHEP
jgi:hypothetical protein